MDTLLFSLSSEQRLKTPQQFKGVYDSKQWGSSSLFSYNVKFAENNKLGVTVSKKVSKLAVDRNRLKRQIREYYRIHQHQLSSAHLVITAKPNSLKATDSQRLASLQELWTKLLKWQRWDVRQRQSGTPAPN